MKFLKKVFNFIFFKQRRLGKDRKPFWLYKIRTMVPEAEKLKKKYLYLNEADGPVFKIKNDPRYTKIGKVFARYGIDEIPQIINVLKGEMAIVGPRPLPVDEAKKIPKKYWDRFNVLPGMTSPWVIKGSHALSFRKWMETDLEYVRNKSFLGDVRIFVTTVYLIFKNIISFK